jgi:drug/metabolite transporter (DMT)-like permease
MVWHYPSDVVGAFLVSAGWALVAVAALRLRPDEVVEPTASRDVAGPVALVMALAAGLVLVFAYEGPRKVVFHAANRASSVVAAVIIGALAALLAAVLARSARA